jgi:hypothetical protein
MPTRQSRSTIDSLLALTQSPGDVSSLKTLIKHDLTAFYKRLIQRAVAQLATLTSLPAATVRASAPWPEIMVTHDTLFSNLEPQQRDAADRQQRNMPASSVMMDSASWRDLWALTDAIIFACLGPYPGEAIDIWTQFQLDRDQRFTRSVIQQISWADALKYMDEVTQAEFPHLRAAAHEGALIASRHTRAPPVAPTPAPAQHKEATKAPKGEVPRQSSSPWAARASVPPAPQAPGRAQWIVANVCRRAVTNTCPFGAQDCTFCHNPAALHISNEEVVAAHQAAWEANARTRRNKH